MRARHGGVGNPLAYALCRFSVVRAVGRQWNCWTRRMRTFDPQLCAVERTMSVDAAVAALRSQSFAAPLRLRPEVATEILQFAEQAECTTGADYGGRRTVQYHKGYWREAEQRLGAHITIGRILDPATRCRAVAAVQQDPFVSEICERYFGYPAKHLESRLYWSFVNDLDDTTRAFRGQNVLFHYDLSGWQPSFLFFQFYLTDVDTESGPLELVKGSHGPKPLRLLLASANHSEETIRQIWEADRLVTLNGSRGEGFVMDGYCMHRATAPRLRERLVLQIRIS